MYFILLTITRFFFPSKSKRESHLNSNDLCLNPSCFPDQLWDLLKDPHVSKPVKPES